MLYFYIKNTIMIILKRIPLRLAARGVPNNCSINRSGQQYPRVNAGSFLVFVWQLAKIIPPPPTHTLMHPVTTSPSHAVEVRFSLLVLCQFGGCAPATYRLSRGSIYYFVIAREYYTVAVLETFGM